jgi:hypothetical protein
VVVYLEGETSCGASISCGLFRDVHVFELTGTFPRLPDEYIPPLGVTGIKYSINVGSLPSLEVSTVQEFLSLA